MNTNPDAYFLTGCGRCPLGNTPQCKVHRWHDELRALRAIAIDCGLTEMAKWGVPCYTYQNKNIILIGAFNDNCTLSFFKGALLYDEANLLRKPGDNTHAERVIRFTDAKEIARLRPILKAYIFEAIEVEKAGLKVAPQLPEEWTIPEEFKQKLAEQPALKAAFEALSRGRQRGYLLYLSAPKQAKTRIARIEKCRHGILAGKGINE